MNTMQNSNENMKIEKQYRDKFGRFALRDKPMPQYKPIQWKDPKFVPGPGHTLKEMRLPEESTRTELYKEHFYNFAYE